MKHAGTKAMEGPLMVHCHRELIHAQWKAIMDDEFMEAYIHGIVLMCPDGLLRRFYLRVFTYSADYPEKCVYVLSLVALSSWISGFSLLASEILGIAHVLTVRLISRESTTSVCPWIGFSKGQKLVTTMPAGGPKLAVQGS